MHPKDPMYLRAHLLLPTQAQQASLWMLRAEHKARTSLQHCSPPADCQSGTPKSHRRCLLIYLPLIAPMQPWGSAANASLWLRAAVSHLPQAVPADAVSPAVTSPLSGKR